MAEGARRARRSSRSKRPMDQQEHASQTPAPPSHNGTRPSNQAGGADGGLDAWFFSADSSAGPSSTRAKAVASSSSDHESSVTRVVLGSGGAGAAGAGLSQSNGGR